MDLLIVMFQYVVYKKVHFSDDLRTFICPLFGNSLSKVMLIASPEIRRAAHLFTMN